MVSSWRKRRNKRRGGNMGYPAPPQQSFGSAPNPLSSPPSSEPGFFAKMKNKASAKAAEMKMKADQMTTNIKNKANNLKFQAQMKGQELQGKANNAYSDLKNKRFDPSIQSAADNFKAGVPKVGEKVKGAAVAVTKIPGKLTEFATSFTENRKSAAQSKIAEGQAQQIMENRQAQMGTVGGYRRKRRKSRRRKSRRRKSRRRKTRRKRKKSRRKRKKSRRKKRRTRRR